MLAIARRWRYKWASGCSYVRDNRCVNKYSCLLEVTCAVWALKIVLLKNKFLKFQCISWLLLSRVCSFEIVKKYIEPSIFCFMTSQFLWRRTTIPVACERAPAVYVFSGEPREVCTLHIKVASFLNQCSLSKYCIFKYRFLRKIHLQRTGTYEFWFENVHIYPLYVKGDAIIGHKLCVVTTVVCSVLGFET